MTTDPQPFAAAGERRSITLPPEPPAAGMARRAVREALHAWNLAHLGDTAVLLVSELVGNAFAADRHAAEQVPTAAPDVPRAAKEHRAFLTRAIQFLATEAKIGQFIDIGPGLPTGHNVHHLAHRYNKAARVCYVDNDPGVLIHGHALLAGTHPGVTMIEGDLREPEKILANNELRTFINLGEPVALCMTLVLHFIPDSQHPHDLVARLLEPLARGSYLIVSHVTGDAKAPGTVKQITQAYEMASAPLVMRSHDEIKRFFGECALVPPEVVYLTQWYRCVAPTPVLGDGGTRWAYAGVGMK